MTVTLVAPSINPIAITAGSIDAINYGVAQRAVKAAFEAINTPTENPDNRLQALKFITFLTSALPLEGRNKQVWVLIQKRLEGEVDLNYLQNIVGLIPTDFRTNHEEQLIKITYSNIIHPNIASFVAQFRIRASTLPPLVGDTSSTIVDYRLSHRPQTPLDRFIRSHFEKNTQATSLKLKFSEGFSRMKVYLTDRIDDEHASEILKDMFLTPISPKNIFNIFRFLPEGHQLKEVVLTHDLAGNVVLEADIISDTPDHRRTSKMTATILNAPPVSEFWKATLDVAADAQGIGAHLLVPFAMFISVLLAVQVIEVPQAYGDAPAFCEKHGFSLNSPNRDVIGLARFTIKSRLDSEKAKGAITDIEHTRAVQKADAISSLSEAAGFSINGKNIGRAILNTIFDDTHAVSMSLNVGGRKARDPLPRIVSQFFGEQFYPLEIDQIRNQTQGDKTVEAILNHWKDQRQMRLEMMESDENLADQFTELLKTFSLKAQHDEARDENLIHISNILNTLSSSHEKIKLLVLERLHRLYQEPASRAASIMVFQTILLAHENGPTIPNDFLVLATEGLRSS